jgi:2-polyprenyl-6-hydroxyphenyl methylase / 3-demethylubiquinone-9 3-methyltransferase
MNQLEYPSDHWAKDHDPLSAIKKTEQLGTLPVNIVEFEMFTSLLPNSLSGRTVLDYGCGLGYLSLLCAQRGATVLGVDRSDSAILTARYQAAKEGLDDRCHFEVRLDSGFGGGSYDFVLAKDVIEHIQDDEQWLEGVAAALKPNGVFIFSTQNDLCLNYLIEATYHRWWRSDKAWMGWDPTHVRFYNAWSLSHLLNRHGFTVKQWASVWIIPYNILSWVTLLRVDVTLPWLGNFDRWFGKKPPFNRLGWSLMAVCNRMDMKR